MVSRGSVGVFIAYSRPDTKVPYDSTFNHCNMDTRGQFSQLEIATRMTSSSIITSLFSHFTFLIRAILRFVYLLNLPLSFFGRVLDRN